MGLIEQLARKKGAIVNSWFSKTIDSYPTETARFLQRQKDPFANPVGQTTYHSLESIIELLGQKLDLNEAHAALDPILRIRAIQAFSPAEAVRFVFDLKVILHKEIAEDRCTRDELRALERNVDELALIAFNIYMQCREKIFELQANETKERTYKAFAKAGLIKELTDEQ